MSKWMRLLVASVTLVVSGLAVAGPASAASMYYTSLGAVFDQGADGQPVHQQRIAINRGTDRVYVTDVSGDQIRVFDSTATGASEGTPFGSGDLTDPLGVAVDQATGAIYVSDDDNVVKYASNGTPDAGFTSPGVTGPIAFDQNANQLVVADTAANVIRRYSATGVAGASFDGSNDGSAFTGLQDIAVAPSGDIYVVDATGDPAGNPALGVTSHVEKYTAAGHHEATVGPVDGAATVAVNAAGDHVFVSGNQAAVFNSNSPTLSRFDTGDLATPVEVLDTGALMYDTIRGLAVDDGPTARLYAATDVGRYPAPIYGTPSLQVYDRLAAATLTALPATDITQSGATLHGTVNPEGADSTYHFEVSADGGGSWTAVDPDGDGDEDAGAGTTDVSVEQAVTGLTDNTEHQFRLVAQRGPVASTSAPVLFTTATIAPTFTDTNATPSEAGVRLSAKIHPHRSTTTWTFEYGTDTDYGKQFPVTAATVEAGTEPVAIARTIGGLQPATSYHYRLVATNGGGTTSGEDHTFTTKSFDVPSSGAGRAPGAYEQVSPVDKGGASLELAGVVQASPSGDGAAYSFVNTLPGSAAGVAHGMVVARRSATGWSSEAIDAPQQNVAGYVILPTLLLSEGLDSAVQFGADTTVPGTVADGGNLYLRDRTGARQLVAATARFSGLQGYLTAGTERKFPAGSTDLSHVAFTAPDPLLPDAVAGVSNVYEFSGGELRLVNRLPDGSVTSGGAVLGSGAFAGPTPRLMSDDGRRVNFGASAGQFSAASYLYQRIDGSRTVAVSAVHRTGEPATPMPALYVGASRDGTKVFFTAFGGMTDQTNDTGWYNHLYRYDVDSDQLTDLTPVNEAWVDETSVIVSDDGRTVAFVSQGSHPPLTPDAPREGNRVYVSRDGVLKYVGNSARYDELQHFGRLSPDGLTLAFTTVAALTGVDNRGVQCDAIFKFGVGTGSCQEVFVYDVAGDHLVCASCDRSMAPQHSDTFAGIFFTTRGGDYKARQVFDDGTVFFNSRARLVAADVNGVRDVYRWNAATGPVLVSSGRGSRDSTFADASADGSSVFFRTVDRLVGQDRDDDVDLYALRVGGGIAAQERSADAVGACDGDTCQGSPMGAVGAPVAGSVVFTGLGDGPPLVRRGRVTLSKRAVGAGSLTVRVKVPGNGTINVSGNGLKSVRRSVAGSSTVSVKLTLTAAARARLRHSHSLRLTVRVSYKPVGGAGSSASLAVTLTGPKAKKSVTRSLRRATVLSMSSTKGR